MVSLAFQIEKVITSNNFVVWISMAFTIVPNDSKWSLFQLGKQGISNAKFYHPHGMLPALFNPAWSSSSKEKVKTVQLSGGCRRELWGGYDLWHWFALLLLLSWDLVIDYCNFQYFCTFKVIIMTSGYHYCTIIMVHLFANGFNRMSNIRYTMKS